jgi:3-oxoadipate enol-lactonase
VSGAALIHYEEYGAGPPLLLVHGVMITGAMFQPIQGQLALRHRVIVPDLRGHGSSRAMGPPYTVAALAADLVQVLDRLEISTIDVLGYSQGGAIAQAFAITYPERCRRLVLSCTYAYNAATLREKIEGRLVPLMIRLLGMPRFARLVISVGLKRVTQERAKWVIGLMEDQDPALMIEAWRQAMAFDSRQRLDEIRCPTLVIAAANDDAVPFHHAKMLHDGIIGSKLVVIADADHALVWAKPEELLRVSEEFLQA